MGGSVSAGHSNAELVYNLSTQHAASKSSLVEQLMLGVDRRAYFLPDFEHFAYQDLAWKHNLIHLSAPVIYWEVLDRLQLKPGLSFLNLGSGTGYLSTMAGLILGPNGINHGVELHQEVIDFAVDKLEHFKQESESMDRYEFCEPQFVQGNCLYLSPDVRQYDRVYVGAACPEDKENYMKNLLKVGGILVMPFRDYLVQIKRVGTTQFKTSRSMQVAFSSLQDPPVESGAAPIPHTKLPELHPRDLRDLARCRIRQLLREHCETECPEVTQLKRFIPKRDVRSRLRVCSSNPGDMHQIISVGYSEQTDDEDEDNNMSDNQSMEDHQHDANDDIYEVRTLDPPTDTESSNDETKQQTKETTRGDGKNKRNRKTGCDNHGKNQKTRRTNPYRDGNLVDREGEENDEDEKLELEEKLENVLKVSKQEEQQQEKEETEEEDGKTRRNSGKNEEKRNRMKDDRVDERISKVSGGQSADNGACSSSKNLYRKSTSPGSSSNNSSSNVQNRSNNSSVQKYVDKEPLTKLESARKFKQLLDDITENRCPGSSRRLVNNERSDNESSCDKLDSERLEHGSQDIRSGLGNELDCERDGKSEHGSQDVRIGLGNDDGRQMSASETEQDDIGNIIDANKQPDIEEKPKNLVGVENKQPDIEEKPKNLVGVKNKNLENENSVVDHNKKSVKNSRLVVNENVNKDVGNAHTNEFGEEYGIVKNSKDEFETFVKSCENAEEEPMDVNDDVQDSNKKEDISEHINAKHIMDTKEPSSDHINGKHAMDTNEPVASSSMNFKREKTDSGVIDDDFIGDNNSNASLDSSNGSLDSGISYHSALNAYMESVREMKRTYANRHKAQNSFLKALMDSARDGDRDSENQSRKKTLGELFGDGACTFGDSNSRNGDSSSLKPSTSSGNSKTNSPVKQNNSSSDTTNKPELDSCNEANKVSINGPTNDNLDEIMMGSDDQPQAQEEAQACSSKHTEQNENETNKHGESSSSQVHGENSSSTRHVPGETSTSHVRGETSPSASHVRGEGSTSTSHVRSGTSSTSHVRGESSPSTSHADGNRESKNQQNNDNSDVSRSKKSKYPNQDNTRNCSSTSQYGNREQYRNRERYGNSSEEKEPSEEKLPYPTYAELQAMRQKLLAKIRDRSRATSSNDSSESDVEPYLSNGRFDNLQMESRFPADNSSSSRQNENYTKSSGRNKNYNSGTRCQDRNKPSGSKTRESKPNSSEDARPSGSKTRESKPNSSGGDARPSESKTNSESKPNSSEDARPSGSKTNSESKPNSTAGDARMSEDGDEDLDGEETYESKRKYTTDSEHGDDESESNDDLTKSNKKNKKFKDRNTEEERQVSIEAERLARAAQAIAQHRDGLLNFLDEAPPPTSRPLFHVFNRGMFEVMSPTLRREAYNEEEVNSDEDEDFILKDLDKEDEEEADDGRPTYTSLMKEKIQELPLPNLVKKYLNYDRDF